MRPEQNMVRRHKSQVFFFMFLAVASLALSLGSFASSQWGSSLLWAPLVFAFAFVAWKSLSRPRADGTSSGLTGAGRPAPINPAPTHHLIAAKAIPQLTRRIHTQMTELYGL